jgi:hypothetical protein
MLDCIRLLANLNQEHWLLIPYQELQCQFTNLQALDNGSLSLNNYEESFSQLTQR